MTWTLSGLKTYIAVAGLVCLAIYQFSIGNYEAGFQSLLAAGAAAGLRNAISGNKEAILIAAQLPPKE